MALDAGLFAQMGAKPKSYGDYRQEIDQQNNNALVQSLNALKLQQEQQGVQDDQALRAAARSFGADTGANYNALMQQGLPGQAQKYQTGILANQKTQAEIGKDAASTTKTKIESAKALLDQGTQILQSANSPQAAMQMAQQSAQVNGVWNQQSIQGMFGDMPQDQAGFEAWKQKQLVQGMEIGKKLELAQKAQAEARQGANEMMIPDGKGGYKVNEPLVGAKSRVAQSGAMNVTMGSPVAVQLPDGSTAMVQPGNRPGVAPQLMTIPGTTQPLRPAKDPNADKPLNDSQAKALLFGSRMQEAEKVLTGLEGKYSPSAINAKSAAESTPLIGGLAGMAGNAMLSDAGQQAEQAQRDFINAVLRRESGAAISAGEFENARKQYFPQPEDKPGNLAQKRANRQLAIKGLLQEVPASQRGVLSSPSATAAASAAHPADIEDLLKKYGK